MSADGTVDVTLIDNDDIDDAAICSCGVFSTNECIRVGATITNIVMSAILAWLMQGVAFLNPILPFFQFSIIICQCE